MRGHHNLTVAQGQSADGPGRVFYTIGLGESNFAALEPELQALGITTVVDVRSFPDDPDSDALAEECRVFGFGYVWMGDRMGTRPRHPSLLDAEGRTDWEAVRASPGFRAGLGELRALAERGTVVILCSEESPEVCHRSYAVAAALDEGGDTVFHVVRSGLRRHQSPLGL